MSDEVLTIKLTAREIDLLHQCISTNIETVKRRHDVTGSTADLIQELGELSDDLLEQRFRPEDPDLFMDPVDFAVRHDTDPSDLVICDAETRMFNAGGEAREKMKATSRAADRRNFNLKGPDKKLSAQQQHDVWDANDPRNW
jgi:hypothetical protein